MNVLLEWNSFVYKGLTVFYFIILTMNTRLIQLGAHNMKTKIS